MHAFAIYEHPAEHPTGYIVRRWDYSAEKVDLTWAPQCFETLLAARLSIPLGMARMPRFPVADADLREAWL